MSEAKASGHRRRRRLFVALDLPDGVRAALPRPEAPWKAVPAENLHVTLAFLGDVDPDAARAALASVLPAAPTAPAGDARPPPAAAGPAPRGRLRVTTAILLPPRRPRVLAVELEDVSGAWTVLQAAVSGALVEAGVYEPESRPWLPHVTIGRTRERVRRDASLPAVEPVSFEPAGVTLYASAGGRYRALTRS